SRRTPCGASPVPSSVTALLSSLHCFADLDLEASRHRAIVFALGHAFGEVFLSRREGIGLIVRIAVALAVAELLHQAGRRIAQMHRDFERTVLRCLFHCFAERRVDSLAPRGPREA